MFQREVKVENPEKGASKKSYFSKKSSEKADFSKLWVIKNSDGIVVGYLFGTAHFINASEKDLLAIPSFKSAMDQVDLVLTELNYTNIPKIKFTSTQTLDTKNVDIKAAIKYIADHLSCSEKSLDNLDPESLVDLFGYFSGTEVSYIDREIALFAHKYAKQTNFLETYWESIWRAFEDIQQSNSDPILECIDLSNPKNRVELLNKYWKEEIEHKLKHEACLPLSNPDEHKKVSDWYLNGTQPEFWEAVAKKGAKSDYMKKRDKIFFQQILNYLKKGEHTIMCAIGLSHLPGIICDLRKEGYTLIPVDCSVQLNKISVTNFSVFETPSDMTKSDSNDRYKLGVLGPT